MATLGSILNLLECGSSAVLGTGTKGCKPFFKKATAIWFTPQGFKFDSTQEFDETYIQLLQAQGNLIVLKGIRTFTDNTPDDTVEELEDGTKQLAKLGLYEFALQFINGLYFNAALHSLSSFANYDATFVDREGNLLGTTAIDGSLKGFSVGMLQATKLTWATDTTAQREGIMMQLTERAEIDSDFYFIQREQFDFNPNLVDGINEVTLAYDSVPANAATTITVKATMKQDGSVFTGVLYTDFLHTIDGVESAITAGDDTATAGTFVFTVPALATNEVSAIELYDNSNNRDVIALDSVLYKSKLASATVV
ncbi:MAG: hypothetical protein ABFS35_17795 [Bacteroidota bacterium]